MTKNGVPVVFIDREQKGQRISSVVFDSFHEGELVAKYLLELGNTTFGYVQGVEYNFDNTERLRGFRETLRKAGYTLEKENIIRGEFEREDAYNSTKEYIESAEVIPEAIFAANDVSAIGTIEALMEEGIKVPEQVNVIGCDDIELAQLVKPSVSTVGTSFDKQGAHAVSHLIALIKEEEQGCIEVLHGRFIPRESTCVRD